MPAYDSTNHDAAYEALEIVARSGATYEELYVNLYSNSPSPKAAKQSLTGILNRGRDNDTVVLYLNRYYLSEFAPLARNGESAVAALGVNHNGVVPLHSSKRAGICVELYTSPQGLEEVVQVTVNVNGAWFKIPLFGNLRICLGPTIPQWSENQEVNTGISTIRVYFKGGKYEEISTNPRHPITIDRAG